MKHRNKSGAIAIVDDDEPLRKALASVLKSAGFRVATFGSAEEFLESSERQTAACLLLDVRLPGMSGVELQRCLIQAGQPVPIVFVSAHGDDSLRDVLLKSGARAFLSKPVRRETLLAEIGAAMGDGAET